MLERISRSSIVASSLKKIYEELSKIEGLSVRDRFAVGRKIIKENNEVEFFSIPEGMSKIHRFYASSRHLM